MLCAEKKISNFQLLKNSMIIYAFRGRIKNKHKSKFYTQHLFFKIKIFSYILLILKITYFLPSNVFDSFLCLQIVNKYVPDRIRQIELGIFTISVILVGRLK